MCRVDLGLPPGSARKVRREYKTFLWPFEQHFVSGRRWCCADDGDDDDDDNGDDDDDDDDNDDNDDDDDGGGVGGGDQFLGVTGLTAHRTRHGKHHVIDDGSEVYTCTDIPFYPSPYSSTNKVSASPIGHE